MNVLLIGHGAREHALAQALTKNPGVRLYSVMSSQNPGLARLSQKTLRWTLSDPHAIAEFAVQTKCELAVVGPEAPLAACVADTLFMEGVHVFGPLQELAQLETSKGYCRELLHRNSIPGLPKYRIFSSDDGLDDYLHSLGPCVVKADGLAGGKGVKVWGDHLHSVEDALSFARDCLKNGKVIVEEKLEGEEFSLQSIADGKTVLDCPPVQDHKRAFENDEGGNTGGMGSYSCEDHLLPFLTEDDLRQAHAITESVMDALRRETGKLFSGVMYGGFMATARGVKLLEYNVRFGDPEAMNILPLLQSDCAQVCLAAAEHRLHEVELDFAKEATVVKYLVPAGYPDSPVKGAPLSIDEAGIQSAGGTLFYGSVDERNGQVLTTSSRALAVMGRGATLREAERIAETSLAHVKGKVFHRSDIGTQALVEKRVRHMQKLRSA